MATDPTRKKARARATALAKRQATVLLKKRKAVFLATLEDTHLVTAAAKACDVHRSTVYEWRAGDVEFAAAWAEVEERSTEEMEREAYRRAVDGWVERGIYEDGKQVGEVRKFSDVLLMFMLKARRPNTYREHHKIELAGLDGAPIAAEITTVDAKEAADASHDFLARIAGPAA